MQGTVEKYRYVRAHILRLLHMTIATSHQVALEIIKFTGDERCLPTI